MEKINVLITWVMVLAYVVYFLTGENKIIVITISILDFAITFYNLYKNSIFNFI
jgi:hypothetical protein